MEITINYKGVELDIEFDYQPYEAHERGPYAQYPGCGESVEVNEIKHQSTDFYEVFEDNLEEIEEVILEAMHEENEY